MRLVFMGSPEFSTPSLEVLVNAYNVVGVVTQPDRPAGRGKPLRQSAVKSWSLKHGLPLAQPTRLKDPDAFKQFQSWDPDLIVVVAYGQILPKEILDLPKWGSINLHASLLPRWRGAAPIQAAILHGDTVTGVTIMKMDQGMDTGPILSQQSTTIGLDETGGQLADRLSTLGAQLLMETLPLYISGELQPKEQNHSQATLAPMLEKADGALDIRQSAERLARQVRAYEPWPSSFLMWGERRIVVRKAHAIPGENGQLGQIIEVEGIPAIVTRSGQLVLDVVQPAGRTQMSGDAFLRGAQDFLGEILGLTD